MAARLPKSTFVSHKSCVRNFTASLLPHCIPPRQLTLVHRDRFVGEALPEARFANVSSEILRNTSLRSFELIVNQRLRASFNTSHIVAHVVEASFGWVDLDHNFKLTLATGQLVLPVGAMRLAVLDDSWLWVFACFEHLLDVVWLLGQMRGVSVFME